MALIEVTHKFDSDNPDDMKQMKRVAKCDDMSFCLHYFDANMIKEIEREIEAKEAKGEKVSTGYILDKVSKKIADTLEENSVVLEDIMD